MSDKIGLISVHGGLRLAGSVRFTLRAGTASVVLGSGMRRGHLTWDDDIYGPQGRGDASYSRPVNSVITQLEAQGPSRTCNESKEEGETEGYLT